MNTMASWGRVLGGVLPFLAVRVAFAAQEPIATRWQDIGTKVLFPIMDVMFALLIVVSAVMIMVAAWKYLTAGQDAEKVSSAHKTITWAAVAIVVALLAKGFPLIIGSIFGIESFGQ